ncbi:condensation domain-containing protein [Nonomuraea sp. NPDC046802]|uniref:condensation domain-containing protein n=1 Tax=Nonomuraea sp. NPDC046802 TaxID=3154919 RepID=UPI0033F4036E
MGLTTDGPLLYGQLAQLRELEELPAASRSENNRVASIRLPPGTTVAAVRSALKILCVRHESLRTTYDLSRPRSPRQVMHDPRSVPDAVRWDGPVEAAADRIGALHAEAFDLRNEFAWRLRILAEGSNTTHLVLIYHHIATDAFGLQVFRRDLLEALGRSPDSATGGAAYSLVTLARQQRMTTSAAQLRQVRHWESVLAGEARVGIVGLYDGAVGPVLLGHLTSRRWRTAAERVASTSGTSIASVILTAYACALRGVHYMEAVPIRLASANRFSAKWKDFIALSTQWMPLGLEVPWKAGFRGLVETVHSRSVRAHSLGGYDIDTTADLCGVPVRQLTGLGMKYAFNYIPTSIADPLPPVDESRLDAIQWEELPAATVYRGLYLKVVEHHDSWYIALTGMGVDRDVVEAVLGGISDAMFCGDEKFHERKRSGNPGA